MVKKNTRTLLIGIVLGLLICYIYARRPTA